MVTRVHPEPLGTTAGLATSSVSAPPRPASPRSSTHILSKSTLYCSSPRPPSTSWSSLVMISFSNCNYRERVSEQSGGRSTL